MSEFIINVFDMCLYLVRSYNIIVVLPFFSLFIGFLICVVFRLIRGRY